MNTVVLETLKSKILDLEKDKNEVLSVIEGIRNDIKSKRNDSFNELFYDLLNSSWIKIHLEIYNETIRFYTEDKNELFSLYFNYNWEKEEGYDTEGYDTVDISYYSTSTKLNHNNNFELNRLIFLGQIADFVLKSGNELLRIVNDYDSQTRERIEELKTNSSTITEKLFELKKQVEFINYENLKALLLSETGYVLPEKKKNLDITHKIYVRNVVNIKITKVNKAKTKGEVEILYVNDFIEEGDVYSKQEYKNVNLGFIISQIFDDYQNSVK